MSEAKEQFFTRKVMEWSLKNPRQMPWKGEKDPYKIWLSEIILQQTRVEQGTAYYNKFIERFPQIKDLALASEDEVLKLWEGLGYYSRARNLHFTAKKIFYDFIEFPKEYSELCSLKGVGAYTAAAIASFAYDLPYAVLDGNVFRVLARFFNITLPIDSTFGKKYFSQLSQKLLDISNPGAYNQAIMDFGATCCTPNNPKCNDCPLNYECDSFIQSAVKLRPVKTKKNEKRVRVFHYLVFDSNGRTAIRKRTENDIWNGLYEFPYIEISDPNIIFKDLETIEIELKNVGIDLALLNFHKSSKFVQILTHQKIEAYFWEIIIDSRKFVDIEQNNFFRHCIFGNKIELKKMYAFPQIIDRYFRG